ncbi:hypothetical protein [Carboxylicivirga sp. N1Y90]|uniref:hypothetical protein n=1 Tax=Carboxylicivirga fragile TaxID=3417571 RepID=UPI003D3461E5|nr:hypothetical protein [Marinilabiliaceae bacterium N1Y90]
MKRLFIVLTCISLLSIEVYSQSVFDTKKWKGRYPTMNNDYPLSFVCWKGWLPPVAHSFVRLYPSHYYYYANSEPVYDVKGYLHMGVNDAIKLILKSLDKKTLGKCLDAVGGIMLNQEAHEIIEGFLRDSRLMNIPDVYGLTQNFQLNLQALDYLKQQNVPSEITEIFENAIRQQMEAYLMINHLDAEQADKIKAMGEVQQELKNLLGSITYSTQKFSYYQMLNQSGNNLDFMGQ